MTTPNLRRALAALGAAFLWLAIGLVPAGGQSTRATLNAYNNTYIVANGVGAITGPILNADIGGLISSAGMLADTNAWTGANSFSQMPTLSACTGYLTGNGGSPASCSPTIPATALAAGAAAINLDRTTYASHAALTTAVAAVTTDTIEQRGYYGVGDGGWALYDWNSTSLATADGVLVILPSGQSSGTAGRYILRIPAEGVHPEVAGAYGNMPLTGVAATASWAANATTIAVPSGQGWSAGQIIYDTTTGRRIGTVASYSGTSLGVSGGGAAYASSGNADVLAIGNDDTTALQNLLNYVSNSSAAGGTIILNTKKGGTAYLIDSASVTIPNNVKLKGVGMPYFSSYSAGASVGWPMIQLNPAYSISPQEGSSAQDLLVWRAGLAPYPSTSEQLFNYQINVLCDFGGWSSATGRCSAGTSVAFNVQKRDVKLDNIMVVGFNKAVYGNQSPRLGLRHLYCDDANCFEITNVGDVYYVNDVRGQQPWTSNLTEQFSVYSATVPSGGGGTGYTVGDLLNVPSGVPGTLTCTTNAILRVSGVSSGAVTSFEVDNLNGSDTGQCARYNVAETWGLTASTLPTVWAAGSGGTNGTNVPLYLVQGAAKQTATASWTASTTITVNSCPAASSVTANVTPVLDGTPTTPSVLGLFVSCSGTTLTLSAASSGSNGDTLYFSQCNTFPALQGTISGGALSAITGVSAAGACVAQVRPNLLTSVVGGGLANAQVNGALVANANGVQVAQDYYAKNPVTLTTNHCAGSCSGAQALISMFGGAYRPGIGGYVHDTGDGAGFSDIEFEGEQTDFKLANLSFQKWRNIGGENFEGDWDLPGVGLDLEGAMSDVSLDQLEFEGNSTAYLLNNTGGATLIDLGLGFGSGQTHAAHNQGIVTGSGSSGVILGAHLNSASGYSGNGSPPPIQIGSNSGSWVIDDVMNSGSGSLTPYSAWFGVAPSAAPPTSPQLGWRLGPINVNGDFNFDQVNEGATAGANAGYRADLWRSANIGAAGVTSVRQTAGNPTGFNYNLLLTSGTPTTPGSGQSDYLYSPVEAGQTFAALQWGGSGAQQAEIEGQVKASVAGTYDLVLWNSAKTASYVHPITIASAGQWQAFAFTVPGPTFGSWNAAPGSIALLIGLDLGAYCPGAAGAVCSGAGGYVTPATDVWESGEYHTSAGATQFIELASNSTLDFAGVHLIPGPFAVPYNPRQSGDETSLVKRYYQKSFPPGTAASGNKGAAGEVAFPLQSTSLAPLTYVPLGIGMYGGVAPTVTIYNPASGGANNCRDLTAGVDLGPGTTTIAGASTAGQNGFSVLCPLAIPATGDGTWTTSVSAIPVLACPAGASSGASVYDTTAVAALGTYSSCTGASAPFSLNLTANASHASSGSSDALTITNAGMSVGDVIGFHWAGDSQQ